MGPTGCGKTECIKTVAATYREMGRIVRRDTVCTGAVESCELMGYFDPATRYLRRFFNVNRVFEGYKL